MKRQKKRALLEGSDRKKKKVGVLRVAASRPEPRTAVVEKSVR